MGKVQVAVFQESKKGSVYCGDSYFYNETDKMFTCAVADGLGSGEFARESSQIVIDIIKNNPKFTDKQLVKLCNEQLVGRRGVVVGILRLDFITQHFTFSSIGNIGLVVVTNDKKKRNLPERGYLAGYERSLGVMQGSFTEQTNFIMFSDGVRESELSKPYMMYEDVEQLVHTFSMVNDHSRFDDTTLIAMRYE